MRPILCVLVWLVAASAYAERPVYASIPHDAISVVAEVRAKPGKAEELRAITLPLIEQVRREPNNILYFLQEDRAEAGHFVFFEVFASEADFKAHNATPHVQAWFARLAELSVDGVHVVQMRILQPAPKRNPRTH